mgnify:FL=1
MKEVIKKIQQALKSCSESHIIPARDLSFIINCEGKVDLMNANHIVVNGIDVRKVFNISPLENLLVPIVPYLKNKIESLSKNKNLDKQIVTAKIFTKQTDFYPSVFLYEGEKIICELSIEDFTK